MTTPPPDRIVSLLLEDHRIIERRLADLASSSLGARAELFWKLTDELIRHEVAEDVALYPFVRELPGGDQLADARIWEQSEAEAKLARMEGLDIAGSEFIAEFTNLKAAVQEHAHNEENEVFPLISRELRSEDQVRLAEQYRAAKRSAPNHPHPHTPDTLAGNKILGPVVTLVDRLRDASGF